MDQADFVHMVRMGELASAENSGAYRRRVAAFAALGYAWVLGCVLLALALLGWGVSRLLGGQVQAAPIFALLGGATLLWTTLGALWVRLGPPPGEEITAQQAPALFDALERIRRKIKGPLIHHVYLTDEFNACIAQRPRYGLLGPVRNHLSIGMPLLMALDRQRFLAVLGHEYGHLQGGHNRLDAWVYRTRMAWSHLHRHLPADESVVGMVTQAFARWYFPRFQAQSFALARQDEYDADRVAAGLVGGDVMGAALIESQVRDAWLERHFWGRHWSKAADHALPVGPYKSMRRRLARTPDPVFASDALRQALKRLSDLDDTHPGLRDRLEALEVEPVLPAWSQGSALQLLGDQAKHWMAHFDRLWCRDNASVWKQYHAWLTEVRARVQQLERGQAQASADELVELARLLRQIDPRTPVRTLYEEALVRSPGHAKALCGLVQNLPDDDRQGKLHCLDQLWEGSGDQRWWAARTALAELDTPRPGMEHDAAAYKQWRKRLERAQEAEDRAWEELTDSACFARAVRHDLSAFELSELRAQLLRCRAVACAWLVRKELREFPRRRVYLLFVELEGVDADDSHQLCRSLESWLAMPGPVLVLDAAQATSPEELQKKAGDAVFVR